MNAATLLPSEIGSIKVKRIFAGGIVASNRAIRDWMAAAACSLWAPDALQSKERPSGKGANAGTVKLRSEEICRARSLVTASSFPKRAANAGDEAGCQVPQSSAAHSA